MPKEFKVSVTVVGSNETSTLRGPADSAEQAKEYALWAMALTAEVDPFYARLAVEKGLITMAVEEVLPAAFAN